MRTTEDQFWAKIDKTDTCWTVDDVVDAVCGEGDRGPA